MTCGACQRAEANPATGHHQADCLNCQARAIANGPEAHARAADPQALQRVMREVWRDAAEYKRGRVQVWAWIEKLEKEKA